MEEDAPDRKKWEDMDIDILCVAHGEPYVYVDGPSDKTLTRVLKISLNLSRGNISTLFFHYNLYVRDDHLTYIAERCPKLKRLVLPAWNRIKRSVICKAINMWRDLESLTMPSIANPLCIMEEISNNCMNFSELKIMGPCDMFFAHTLAKVPPPPAPRKMLKELDESILEKASRIRERTRLDEGYLRWYKYEEGLWKEDEVSIVARNVEK
ncbi:hypothetical protein M8C21_027286 [Ambrosia artemisiifolia]|uniref:Uncharacterized protein n=1 Tax=Ambrosia artemisiifolia TaxID=4212 RepID=A0AAD5CKZ6_AMBAR|nr:hypothetical protein M8C21_027286 [Ambrosia artemisiifolia]